MRKVDDISGVALFQETIGLPKWVSSLLIISGIFMVMITAVLGFAVKNGSSEVLLALAIVVPIQLIVIIFHRRMKLEKVVTSNGLYYKWLALHKKYRFIDKDELQEMEVKKSPGLKYGTGWTFTYGRFHSVNDGKGLQLYLAGNKRIFFGTENIDRFQKAMNQLVAEKEKRFREF